MKTLRVNASGGFRKLRSFQAALILGCSAVLLHLALTLLYRNNLPLRIPLSDLMLLAADSLAAASLLYAAKRSALHETGARVAWTALAVGEAGRALGDLIVAISEVGLRRTGLPPSEGVLFLVVNSIFVLGLVFLTGGGRSSGERIRRLLDIAIAMIAALLVSWNLVVVPRVAGNETDLYLLLSPLAYAVVYVLLIFALLDLVFGQRMPRSRAPLLLLAGGALAKVAAGWMALIVCPPNGTCRSGDWDASVWVVSAVMVGLGGLQQARLTSANDLASPAAQEGKPQPSNSTVYLSYVWVAAAYLLLISNYGQMPSISFSVLLWGTGAIIGLVTLRQILVLNENRQLYAAARQEVLERGRAEAEIRRLNAELEQRVIARTAQLETANRELQNEIDERRRAEQETRRLQEFNESIVQNMSEGIVIEDSEGRLTFVNPAAAARLGYMPGELVGKHWTVIIPPDQRSIVLEADQRRARGERDQYELELVGKDGQRLTVLAAGSPRFDVATGKFAGTMAIFVDITERKGTEEALALERTWLRTLIDNVPDYMYVKDTQSRFVIGNLAIAHSFGKASSEEIYGKTDFDYHAPDLAAQFFADEQGIFRDGEPLINREEYVIEPSGDQKWLITTKVPLRDREGSIVGLVGVGRDITKRKLAEEALLKFKLGIERTGDAVFMTEPNGTIVYVNPAFEQLYGYRQEEVLGKTPRILKSGILPREAYDQFWKALLNKQIVAGEIVNKSKDGRLLSIEGSSNPILNEDGDLIGFLAIQRDITERKRAEEARRLDSEIMANIANGVYLIRASDGTIVYTNPQFERMFGYGPGELIGKHVSIVNAPTGKNPQGTAEEIIEALNKNGVWKGEVHNIKKDGTPFWCDASVATFAHSEYGTVWLSVHQDITERKRAEEALKASDQYAKSIIDSSLDMIITTDRERRIVEFNRAAQAAFGYSHTEVLGQHVGLLYADPEEGQAVHGTTFEKGQVVREILNRRKNGENFPALLSAAVMQDAEGELIGAVGISRDITEFKRMESQLRESNEKLKVWVKQLEQSSREIALLSQMGDLLQSCRNAEEAYQVIARSGRLLFPAESGALFVLNNSRNLAELMAAWGESSPTERAFTPDDCWGLRRGRLYVVEAPDSDVICAHLGKDASARYLCIPMMAQGETLGVLHLQSGQGGPNAPDEHFPASKQQLAVTVAEHIALSLASLQLRETLRSQAIRDPLTGLFNRRYMEETIEREIHRAARNAAPLGIIMFDIDHLKEFNDHFGHGAGDALLRELGAYLDSKIRREDIACRYGGDEFILVLPECSIETTRARAEQLRDGFKNLTVKYHGQSLPTVTLSLGITVFPAHGSDVESLLRKADQALYRAKAEGRDRVAVAG